jgi:hypothetical protein
MRTTQWCRRRAAAVGPSRKSLAGELLADNALYRLRAAQASSGWRTSTTRPRLEVACAKAIAAGDPPYRTVRGILAAGAERDQPPGGRRGIRVPAARCRSRTSSRCAARSPATPSPR